jgi:formylglycine-generating enzyme required for sulfatase activity
MVERQLDEDLDPEHFTRRKKEHTVSASTSVSKNLVSREESAPPRFYFRSGPRWHHFSGDDVALTHMTWHDARLMSSWVRRFDIVMCLGLAACVSSPGGRNNDAGVDSAPADSAPADVPIDEGSGHDGPPPEFLSCATLPATCGANGNDSCCNSLEVLGGMYLRSFDLAGDVNSGDMSHPATVSDFRLDKYEVTVGRFREFVNARMGTQSRAPRTNAGAHPNIAGSGWDSSWSASLLPNTAALTAALHCDPDFQTWTDVAADNEHRPMNCMTWFEAMAFCIWDGGYLPTEAEWNYAAAGGDQQRAFPWSNPAGSLFLDPIHASYAVPVNNCIGDGVSGCAVTDLIAVGTRPAGDGRWGQSDLAGNVTEWNLDWASMYPDPCVDCANLTPAAHREYRGGSFASGAGGLRTGFRLHRPPSDRNGLVGLRCARSAR